MYTAVYYKYFLYHWPANITINAFKNNTDRKIYIFLDAQRLETDYLGIKLMDVNYLYGTSEKCGLPISKYVYT